MAVSDNVPSVPRVGIVGAGFISQVAHLPHYANNPDCELLALAEFRPQLRRKVCERWGIARPYSSHIELLQDDEIQAVVVVVRRHHTASVVMDALSAGKHVFSEKPMAQTFEVAKSLVAEAQARNLIYSVGFMRRYDAAVLAAKKKITELIAGGDLGEIKQVKATLIAGGDYCNIGGDIKTNEPKPTHIDLPIAPEYVPEKYARAYEHFVNTSGHTINLMRFLFPDVKSNVPYVLYKPDAVSMAVLSDETFPVLYEWADAPAHRSWEESIEVQFEAGALRLVLVPAFLRNQASSITINAAAKSGFSSVQRESFEWTWSFEEEDKAFIKAITEASQTRSNGGDCLKDFEIIDKIWLRVCQH